MGEHLSYLALHTQEKFIFVIVKNGILKYISYDALEEEPRGSNINLVFTSVQLLDFTGETLVVIHDLNYSHSVVPW